MVLLRKVGGAAPPYMWLALLTLLRPLARQLEMLVAMALVTLLLLLMCIYCARVLEQSYIQDQEPRCGSILVFAPHGIAVNEFKSVEDDQDELHGEMLSRATDSTLSLSLRMWHNSSLWCAKMDQTSTCSTSMTSSDYLQLASEDDDQQLHADVPDKDSLSFESQFVPASSLCMSRCSVENVDTTIISHAVGELYVRRDPVYYMFKRWSKCTLELSILNGELLVQRKQKIQRLPLKAFTGVSFHPKRHNVFKVLFYGQDPLQFRANNDADARLWVQALEYAKEVTWGR